MLETHKIKELYKKIQNKLFYMVPEKWDKLCLHASVIEQIKNVSTGELYFYYFPKGILKKDPINVYEIPNRFNINEDTYLEQIKELYNLIKELWEEFLLCNTKRWYSINIIMENFKFKIEYHYEDIRELPYNQEQLHVIWKYEYLGLSLESFSKKNRKLIEQYLDKSIKKEQETYEEGVYKRPAHHIISYEKIKDQEEEKKEEIQNMNQILAKKS